MFFFIGGITPRIKKLDSQPRICPRCHQVSLFRIRIDHYLNIFFIPICPVKKGKPFFSCENCGLESPEPDLVIDSQKESSGFEKRPLCPGCRRSVAPEFSFCPYCGRALN